MLDHKGVLITRAVSQAEPMARAVRAAGGRPVLLPAIRIEPIETASASGPADWVIFISPNAVEYGLSHVREVVASGAQVAAVGPSTARALSAAGLAQPLRAREGFDSESLLALPVFRQCAGSNITIVRGVGGRPLLIDSLRDRGAKVTVLEVYRRDRPTLRIEQVQYLESQWAAGGVAVTTCLSVATLDNLMTLLTTRAQRLFMATPLLSPSPRVLERATELGHTGAQQLARGPRVEDLVAELIDMAAQDTI